MSTNGNEKTPSPPQPDPDRQPGSGDDSAITPPKAPDAGHGAGGDPLIEGP